MENKPNPELWVTYMSPVTKVNTAVLEIRSCRNGTILYSLKGPPEALERNHAELLAIVRLARDSSAGGWIVSAKLDVESVVALVPQLKGVLCRN